MKKGLIHIYCGDGKGKTTAAMGLAIRAAGREKKVFITQFLKSGKSGEIIKKNEYDLLILDEIIATINNGFIELEEVVNFLKNKPDTLEVVMTGRDPKEELIEIANYVTEMKCIKHPFREGIPSRIGIEFGNKIKYLVNNI